MSGTRQSALRSMLACNLGICLEGFDFIAFSFFSVIIAQLFFPTGNDLTAIMLAFASFGLAYVIRPLGGIVWGIYADRFGRRSALVWIALSMALGVAVLAATPPYAVIGLAAPLLVMLARLLQGFSAGGEFASATAMLVELAPPGRRGLYASTQMASQVLTVGVTSLVVLVLHAVLAPAALAAWGWRAVFAVGVLIGPVGFYMRARMAESPEFLRLAERRGAVRDVPLSEVFRTYRWESLCIAGLTVVGSASFYLIMIFLPIYAARSLGLPMVEAQIATILVCVLQFAACLVAGALSDRFGRRAVMLPATLAYAVLCYPLFAYLIGHPTFGALLAVLGTTGLILGFISGPFPAAASELYPTEIRSSGLGAVYNIAGALFGGLGPFFITSLIGLTGDKASPAWWALATGMIGAAAVWGLRFTRLPPAVASAPAGETAASRI